MKSKKRFLAVFLTIAMSLIASAIVPVCFAGQEGKMPPVGSNASDITHYEFGSMEVNGKIYKYPYLRISPDGTITPWPMVSHYIEFADIESQIDQNTRIIIIGTGDRGGAIIPKEARAQIKARGIELYCLKTASAVELFNKLSKENLVGLFHLTC